MKEQPEFEQECPQCGLGDNCGEHGPKKPYPASMPTFAIVESDIPSLTDEDRRSSERLADLELEHKRLQDEENRQLTPGELDEFFKGMNQDLFGKAS